jgi:chitin disaccharide deacetylase
MRIPDNIIVNADDLGYDASVNTAILFCFEHGYINSSSLMTNMNVFEEAVTLIHEKPAIKNIGVHINLAEGKPLTNIPGNYLDSEGNWNVYKTNRVSNSLSTAGKAAFLKEINAQIGKALTQKIPVSHLDSHLHLHTLPCFYKLFLTAAKQHNLKLRLAQTYREGSHFKYYYRRYINNLFKKNDLAYSDRFETFEQFFKNSGKPDAKGTVEIMLHPLYDQSGKLTDHYDPDMLKKWIEFLENS